jgi:hypothetical protein
MAELERSNIESVQEDLRQQGSRIVRTAALRRLLAEFDPQNTDATLDYAGLLQRAQSVLAKEVTGITE